MNNHALSRRWYAGAACILAISGAISPSLNAAPSTDRQSSLVLRTFLADVLPGWQMVSSPFIVNQSLSDMGAYAAVWNPASGQYAVTPTAPADTFHPGQGYWIYLDTRDITITGPGALAADSQPFSISLQSGWNMIGNPFNRAVPLSNLTVVDAAGNSSSYAMALGRGLVSPLYAYNSGRQQYVDLGAAGQPLGPWLGAWIFASAPMTLVMQPPPPLTTANAYRQVNLTADVSGAAPVVDTLLVNPVGLVFTPSGRLLVPDNGSATLSTCDFAGVSVSPDFSGEAGIFALAYSHPAAFHTPIPPPGSTWGSGYFGLLSASEGGALGGGPSYTGLAVADIGGTPFLDKCNFRAGEIDVFNTTLELSGPFADPTAGAGFAPFNVTNIGGNLYVSYAKQAADGVHDQPGAGNGFIDVFSPDGILIKRLVSNGVLNSPWGMALAPADFGAFSNSLLVANHGDGTINAFDLTTGAYLGALADSSGNPIVIDGLWGIVFGNGAGLTQTNTLYFTAGPQGGTHGLLGKIEVAGLTTGSAGGNQPLRPRIIVS